MLLYAKSVQAYEIKELSAEQLNGFLIHEHLATTRRIPKCLDNLINQVITLQITLHIMVIMVNNLNVICTT